MKTSTELEALFSNTRPELVLLQIDRAGVIKATEHTTEKVSEILMQNHLGLADRVLVPAELADEDIHCFREKE